MRFTAKARGTFQQQLEERISKWRDEKAMAARIRVPDALHWWAWQEFGVPLRTITPVEAKMLAFPGDGGTELRTSVVQGVRAHHTVQNAMDEILHYAKILVQEALRSGAADNPESLRQAVLDALVEAKAIIAAGMAEDLPGTRPANPTFPKQSGKLMGETAASVFDAQAEVVPTD